MSESRGRPRVYSKLIDAIKVEDGWVDVCAQANRTAPSGFRGRYPGVDFRIIPNEYAGFPALKPYLLQARRIR